MSDDTPTPPKQKRIPKVDMSDMGPRPKDPRDGGDPVAYNAWGRVYTKRYNEQYPEKKRERRRRYRKRNPEKEREKERRYRKRNPEKVKEWERRYRERNPEIVRERERRYRKLNPEKTREKGRRNNPLRRARKRRADIPLTPEELQQVEALYAQRDILTKTTGIKHHVDHIVPLVKGGIHHPINLRVITWEKNVSKGDKLTPEAMILIPLIEALKKERHGWLNNQSSLEDLFEDEDNPEEVPKALRKGNQEP